MSDYQWKAFEAENGDYIFVSTSSDFADIKMPGREIPKTVVRQSLGLGTDAELDEVEEAIMLARQKSLTDLPAIECEPEDHKEK